MKYFFLVSFLLIHAAVNAKTLEYVFSVKSNKNCPYIHTELTFQPGSSNITYIKVPEKWTDAKNLKKNLNNITVKIDNVSSKVERKKDYLIISTPRGAKNIKLSYDIISNNKERHPFKPIIEKNYTHFFGITSLLYPEDKMETQYDVSLTWNIPNNWDVCNSYGCNQRKQWLKTSLYDLKYSSYSAGKIKYINLNEDKIKVVQVGELKIAPNNFGLFLRKIISEQRKFFNDLNPKESYFITLISFPPYHGKSQMTGTHIHNGFALFLPNDQEPLALSKHMLAHEHVHFWLGKKLKPALEDTTNMAWFFEGFTDYVALITELSSEVVTKDEFVADLNDIIKKLAMSPHKYITNLSLEEKYWDIPALENIPYLRGCLLALVWDNKIRYRSNNKYTIANPLNDMLSFARIKKLQRIDQQNVIKAFYPYLGKTVERDINDFIHKGLVLENMPRYINHPLQLKLEKMAKKSVKKSEEENFILKYYMSQAE